MPKITKNCPECGAEFSRFPSQPRVFCSKRCRALHRARLGMPLKPRRGETVPCPVCGKGVYRNKHEAEQGKRFCSVACKNVGARKTPTIKSCPQCGATMTLKPSQAARIYCSKRCEAISDIKRPLERMHNGRRAKLDTKGYVMVWQPDHPNRAFHGWQYEHRLVAEATIGRRLSSDEAVHHINGIKDDNRPENLEVMGVIDHAALSARDYRDQIARERAELERYRQMHGPLPQLTET